MTTMTGFWRLLLERLGAGGLRLKLSCPHNRGALSQGEPSLHALRPKENQVSDQTFKASCVHGQKTCVVRRPQSPLGSTCQTSLLKPVEERGLPLTTLECNTSWCGLFAPSLAPSSCSLPCSFLLLPPLLLPLAPSLGPSLPIAFAACMLACLLNRTSLCNCTLGLSEADFAPPQVSKGWFCKLIPEAFGAFSRQPVLTLNT